MFRKIRLFKKLLKIVKAVENFYGNNREKFIEEARKALPEIKGYITDFERLLERIGGK